MTPSMNAQFMSIHVLVLNDLWSIENPGTDDEKCGMEGLRLEVGEEFIRIETWSVIVSVTIFHRIGAGRYVDISRASTTGPPAITFGSGLSNRLCILSIAADTGVCRWDVGDRRPIDGVYPFLHLGGVCGRDDIRSGI
jgi:hypothetical protein